VSRSLSATAKTFVDNACEVPVVGILVRAGLKGQQDSAKDMAASVAFFSFLSLFPLILGLISIGGYFLESADVQAKLHEFIINVFPVSSDFVTVNIDSLVRLRGAASIASLVVLMWSASKMVGALSRGINKALDIKRPYAFYLSKLRNFGLTFTVSIVVFGTIALAPAVEILAELDLGFDGTRWNAFFELVAGHVAGFAITFIMLGIIYTLIPFEQLKWKELLPGLVVATCVIELGKGLFAFYYGNVSSYDLIYGSVSSIIVLLLWLYFCARVVLYGTEVIYVYRQSHQQEFQQPENDFES